MIKLEHVTKYYNKNKINQFAVCKDISLTFENTGLVVVLGPSGSGKTTLLNVISGMDKFDKGRLIFDDVIFDRYSHKKWDSIRKHKIGYVYQNYYLLKELSVYKNIEPILRMQGMTDEFAIRERATSLINAVAMGSYADRLVKQLSGGQQQRVAFARALANNPEVILADEPTGNLDSKTTIELMEVIKEISKTRLIIMVTHEQALCDYYADRIIEIENGTIVKDFPNDQTHRLEFIQEHIINLRDFKKTELHTEQLNVSRYNNEAEHEALDIDLIERNQTLYVKVKSDTLKRIKYIDSESEIIIQEGPQDKFKKENPFILDDIYSADTRKTEQNVFSWRDIFRYAFRKLSVFHGGGKMLYLVLMFVGVIVGICVGVVGEIYHVEEPYSIINKNYIEISVNRMPYADIMAIEDVPGVDQLMLVNEPFMFSLSTSNFYEVHNSINISAQPVDIRFFNPESLILGSIPEGYEIIIDKSVADEIIYNHAERGVLSYDDVLECKFKLRTSGTDTSLSEDSALYFNISGISDDNSKTVWMKEELMYSLVTPYLIDYQILGDNFQIVSGTLPDSSGYIMLNENYPTVKAGSIPFNVGFTTGTYFISGIYQYLVDGVSYDFQKAMVSTLDYIKFRYFVYEFNQATRFSFLVYATNVDATLKALLDAGYTASADVYQPTIAQQVKLQENQNFYLLGLGGIVMSAFCIFLIMRASLVSRMYEVSVYRSIGISRKEIRRIFLIEILLTTSLSSVAGFILTVILLNRANASLLQFAVTYFTGWTLLIGIVGLYVINICVGLIPINMLMQKTPANILKQSDF